jgi:hypothetical protein
MLTISSLPAASRATTQTYRTHSRSSNQALKGFWKASGRSARPPKPYPIPNDADARYSKIEFVPGVPPRPICRKAFDLSTGPHLTGRFRLRGAVVPTLHASSCGSDAVGHVEGYNFAVRTDIPAQRMRSIRKRRAHRAAAVRRPGRRRRRPYACRGGGSGTGRAAGQPGTGRRPRR